jgi:hypothetical protein
VAFSEYLYFISAHLFFHKTFFLQYTLVEIKKFLFNIQLNAHLEKKIGSAAKSLHVKIPPQEKASCKIPPQENPYHQNTSTEKYLLAKPL